MSPPTNAIMALQALALLVTAVMWWLVWQCPCEPTLKGAAFWTAVFVAQGVVLSGLAVLRPK